MTSIYPTLQSFDTNSPPEFGNIDITNGFNQNTYYNNTMNAYPDYNNQNRGSKVTAGTCCVASKKICGIVFGVIFGIILIAGIVILLIYAIKPCVFTRCHPYATCIDSPFSPKCQCNEGYSGNGKIFCDECGIRFAFPNLRIWGGSQAIPDSWPEAVLVVFNYENDYQIGGKTTKITKTNMCGGTLINHYTVLTAAHCIPKTIEKDANNPELPIVKNNKYPTFESMLTVYLGVFNQSFGLSNAEPAANEKLSVEKLTIHESYSSVTLLNDIAVLKLSEIAHITSKVQIACLPSTEADNYPKTNIDSIIVGWGQTETVKSSLKLKNAKITVYDSQKCSAIADPAKNWNSRICAGDTNNKADTCPGDSGGGLFVKDTINGKEKFVISGITSFGTSDCGKGDPG